MDLLKLVVVIGIVSLNSAAWANDANSPQLSSDYSHAKLDKQIEKAPEKELNNKAINWFPIIFYTQESSLALGAGTMRAFKKPNAEANARSNNITAMAFYTLNKQFLIELAPEFYFFKESFNLKMRANYSKMPSLFFGTGEHVPEDYEGEDYVAKNSYFQGDFIAKLFRSFRAGLRYEWHDYTVTEKEAGGLLDQGFFIGEDGGTISGAGLILDQDNRDNTFAATSGAYHQFIAMKYTDKLGSDFEFNQYIIDLRQFIPINKKGVLALQGLAIFSDGEVPFNRLSQLGGSMIMRGIYQGRYRDKNILALQGEYRRPFKHRWYYSVFASIGEVAPSGSEFNGSNLKVTAGGGVRYALDPKNKMHLRFDVGVSEFGVSPIIILGEAF